jgi:uncharacterized protein with FMN-binding domain
LVILAMKKIVLWLMSTLTVLVLLFGYHTSTSSQASATSGSSAFAPISGSSGTSSSSGTSAGGTSSSSGTSSSGATSSGSGSGSGSTSASTTVTGDAADTRYGPVQVQVTVAGGTITDVSVVEYPSENGKDQQINARALPILVQETLDAQSSSIDMVSGATYTSEGYVESLQSALDQAGL